MFNEEKVASKCIDNVISEINKLDPRIKLIVIDDGSTDQTSKILNVKKIQYKNTLVILTHKKNKGYGGAMQTGIHYAIKESFEFYLTMDSDLTNKPDCIKDFTKFISSNLDCVKASRYIKGGKVINVPLFRRIVSLLGNYLASWFFGVGIKDCTNGFKMVRLKFLKGIKFQENNFSIIFEEMYHLKKRGARFIEIPNILYARDDSKSHFTHAPKVFFDYFKYIVKASLIRN